MKNKKKYVPAAITPITFQVENALLAGSITSTKISVQEENVSVESLTNDKVFDEAGFGDISF